MDLGKNSQNTAIPQFKHHYIDAAPEGMCYAQTVLADVDHDGLPEFIVGRAYGDIYWYDYEGPDKWTRYLLGVNSPSDVGATAYDVDGDGWVDFIAGGAWYRNSRDPRNTPFERFVFDPDLTAVHDVVLADLDGDGKLEVITMSDRSNLRWYRIPQDPTQLWEQHDIGPSIHQGVCVGDIDGDGDLDIVRSDIWFENINGDATVWVEHPIAHFGSDSGWQENATLTYICDMNGDGYNDIVVSEAEISGARIMWMENIDGKGLTWKKHLLPQGDDDARGAYHSLYVGDLDGDGDYDIFSCEMEEVPGDRPPRWFIWENVDGKGGEWIEHVIFDSALGGHGALMGDIDGDGDLDICSKIWKVRPGQKNGNGGQMHIDFLENISPRIK